MAEVTLDKVSKEARDYFNKGFGAFERGNLDYAIDLLLKCIEIEPRFLQARKFLRAAEIQKSQQGKAKILSFVKSNVSNVPGLIKAQNLLKQDKADEALMAVERVMKDDPLNERVLKVFTEAAGKAGYFDVAVQTLEIARDQMPENLSVINWLGSLYQRLGRTKDAKACFERLCEIAPNDPEAMKMLKNAMALDSMSSDGWSEAAEKGESFRAMIKDTEEAERLEQQAKAVKSEKDVDSLIKESLEKIEKEPENINYYRNLAKLYTQKYSFDEAVATINKALALSPGDPELDKTLSRIRINQYDYQIARLKEAGDAENAQQKEYEKIHFVFNDLQERVKRYPNDLALRYDWGVMLFDNDYINEAIQQFQLSQRSPNHRNQSLYYMAMCFKTKKQYDLALSQLESAASEIVSMDETKKNILYELGVICELMEDKAKAADYYKQIYKVDIGYRDVAQKIEAAYSS